MTGTFYDNIPGADQIKIGFLSGVYVSSLDVVAHEYTHGITRFTAGLLSDKIPGALNESFSDILGIVIEQKSLNNPNHWLFAYDALGNTSPNVRDFSNPLNKQNPAFFNQTFWVDNTTCTPTAFNDFCGVHTNCTVQDYWFYLLSTGSSINTATMNNTTVQGIGIDNALKITFHNLTNFLGQNSTFTDSRFGSIFAAISLFGYCSNEMKQTMNAWAAVNVGTPSTINFTGTSIFSGASGSPVLGIPATYSVSGDNFILSNYQWTHSANITGFATGPFNSQFIITNITPTNSLGLSPFNGSWLSVSGNCHTLNKTIFVGQIVSGGAIGNTGTGSGGGKKMRLTAAPNPTSGIIHLSAEVEDASNISPWNIYVLNSENSVVMSALNLEDLLTEIDISNNADGIYYVVVSKGDIFATLKCIKE